MLLRGTVFNNSLRVLTFKYFGLTWEKSIQCKRMCSTVRRLWQGMHSGWSSPFKRKPWVKYVCPILARWSTSSSLRFTMSFSFVSPTFFLIGSSLLKATLVHLVCHLATKMRSYSLFQVGIWNFDIGYRQI